MATQNSVNLSTASGSIPIGNGTGFSSLTYSNGNSWTPSLQFGGASVDMTYDTQSGSYSQVGNVVFFNAIVVLSAKGSSTGVARISGLPVAPVSSLQPLPITLFSNINLDVLYTGMAASMVSGSSTILLFELGSGQAGAAMTDALFTNTSAIQMSGFYFTA